jgi:ribosomal protein S18 acetylase RimI-like enzyme
MPDYALTNYDADGAGELLDTVIVPVYKQVYEHEIAIDPFFSVERFVDRFNGYVSAPGFALSVARDETGTPLGYMFGYRLGAGGRWWDGLLTEVPEGFAKEDGARTWAVNEIMVVEEARRRGVATSLHNELIGNRTESRATLLVEPENEPAKAAYQSWGWRFVGTLQPFQDSPKYLSMVRDLPLY